MVYRMHDQIPNPTAAQVAKVLVELAAQDRDVDQEPMTNMRLQKLLYYVQGWSIARRGKPAFDDRLEAWEHGPVVPTVYRLLRDNGKNPISAEQLNAEPVDDELKKFIASVWSDYRSDSAIRLRYKTHAEDPWKDAWAKRHKPNHCQEEITVGSLEEFFTTAAPKAVRKFKRSKPSPQWYTEPSPFFAEGA